MEVKLTAGVVVRMVDKEKREGQWSVEGHARLRRWSMGGATGPKEQGEEGKTTLQMKPHRVRKPFQVAAGHSIKTIAIL